MKDLMIERDGVITIDYDKDHAAVLVGNAQNQRAFAVIVPKTKEAELLGKLGEEKEFAELTVLQKAADLKGAHFEGFQHINVITSGKGYEHRKEVIKDHLVYDTFIFAPTKIPAVWQIGNAPGEEGLMPYALNQNQTEIFIQLDAKRHLTVAEVFLENMFVWHVADNQRFNILSGFNPDLTKCVFMSAEQKAKCLQRMENHEIFHQMEFHQTPSRFVQKRFHRIESIHLAALNCTLHYIPDDQIALADAEMERGSDMPESSFVAGLNTGDGLLQQDLIIWEKALASQVFRGIDLHHLAAWLLMQPFMKPFDPDPQMAPSITQYKHYFTYQLQLVFEQLLKGEPLKAEILTYYESRAENASFRFEPEDTIGEVYSKLAKVIPYPYDTNIPAQAAELKLVKPEQIAEYGFLVTITSSAGLVVLKGKRGKKGTYVVAQKKSVTDPFVISETSDLNAALGSEISTLTFYTTRTNLNVEEQNKGGMSKMFRWGITLGMTVLALTASVLANGMVPPSERVDFTVPLRDVVPIEDLSVCVYNTALRPYEAVSLYPAAVNLNKEGGLHVTLDDAAVKEIDAHVILKEWVRRWDAGDGHHLVVPAFLWYQFSVLKHILKTGKVKIEGMDEPDYNRFEYEQTAPPTPEQQGELTRIVIPMEDIFSFDNQLISFIHDPGTIFTWDTKSNAGVLWLDEKRLGIYNAITGRFKPEKHKSYQEKYKDTTWGGAESKAGWRAKLKEIIDDLEKDPGISNDAKDAIKTAKPFLTPNKADDDVRMEDLIFQHDVMDWYRQHNDADQIMRQAIVDIGNSDGLINGNDKRKADTRWARYKPQYAAYKLLLGIDPVDYTYDQKKATLFFAAQLYWQILPYTTGEPDRATFEVPYSVKMWNYRPPQKPTAAPVLPAGTVNYLLYKTDKEKSPSQK